MAALIFFWTSYLIINDISSLDKPTTYAYDIYIDPLDLGTIGNYDLSSLIP